MAERHHSISFVYRNDAASTTGPFKDFTPCRSGPRTRDRSEEHTSELQSLMRISYAVFCLKKKTYTNRSYLSQKTPQSTQHPVAHTHEVKTLQRNKSYVIPIT